VVAATLRDLLGDAWTPQMDVAWTELLADLDSYVQATPLVGAAA